MWMERFLQGFLFDDAESFSCPEEYRKELIRRLKAAGLLEKKRVCFLSNDRIEKMLINSRGKLESIRQIAELEEQSMKERLRLLILTDYIRPEYRSAVGDPAKELKAIGVLPIFELLRRQKGDRRLGILCGSLVVLPQDALEAFAKEAGMDPEAFAASCRPLTDPEGRETGYAETDPQGRLSVYTRTMTALFEAGRIRILVGTKSLLGEGWDAPCVNALILASFRGILCAGKSDARAGGPDL